MKQVIAIGIVLALSFGMLICVHLTKSGERILVATTTSLYDTGLLEVIRNRFEEEYGIGLHFVPKGTGMAIEQAKRGDVDAILVHAPSREYQFMQEGYGVIRKVIAYNFFAIVGPPNDPAQIRNLSPLEALQKIAVSGEAGRCLWVSRGDESGTHLKEKGLWTDAGFDPSRLRDEPWYIESFGGMGAALRMADEKRAYTLADVGTYLKYYKDGWIDLEALVERGEELLNVYSVIAVNPSAHPEVNFDQTIAFIKFLVSENGQRIIGEYGLEEYGRPLFYPAVNLLEENTDSELASWIRRYAFFDNTECPPEYRIGHNELHGE
jgi:tungstate transport system substrate-binding protein